MKYQTLAQSDTSSQVIVLRYIQRAFFILSHSLHFHRASNCFIQSLAAWLFHIILCVAKFRIAQLVKFLEFTKSIIVLSQVMLYISCITSSTGISCHAIFITVSMFSSGQILDSLSDIFSISLSIFHQSLSVTLYHISFILLNALLFNITSDNVAHSSVNNEVFINEFTLTIFLSDNFVPADNLISFSLYIALRSQSRHSCSVFVNALANKLSRLSHLAIRS